MVCISEKYAERLDDGFRFGITFHRCLDYLKAYFKEDAGDYELLQRGEEYDKNLHDVYLVPAMLTPWLLELKSVLGRSAHADLALISIVEEIDKITREPGKSVEWNTTFIDKIFNSDVRKKMSNMLDDCEFIDKGKSYIPGDSAKRLSLIRKPLGIKIFPRLQADNILETSDITDGRALRCGTLGSLRTSSGNLLPAGVSRYTTTGSSLPCVAATDVATYKRLHAELPVKCSHKSCNRSKSLGRRSGNLCCHKCCPYLVTTGYVYVYFPKSLHNVYLERKAVAFEELGWNDNYHHQSASAKLFRDLPTMNEAYEMAVDHCIDNGVIPADFDGNFRSIPAVQKVLDNYAKFRAFVLDSDRDVLFQKQVDGRIYSLFTQLKRIFRRSFTFYYGGEKVESCEVDINSSYWFAAATAIRDENARTRVIDLINSGKFYEVVGGAAVKYGYELPSERKKLKSDVNKHGIFNHKRGPEGFGKHPIHMALRELFPNLVDVIVRVRGNIHGPSRYSRFATRIEGRIMNSAVTSCRLAGIPCVRVHDAISIPRLPHVVEFVQRAIHDAAMMHFGIAPATSVD